LKHASIKMKNRSTFKLIRYSDLSLPITYRSWLSLKILSPGSWSFKVKHHM